MLKFLSLTVSLLLGVSFIISGLTLAIFVTISHTSWIVSLLDFSLAVNSSAAAALLLFIAGTVLVLIAREIIFLLILIVYVSWSDALARMISVARKFRVGLRSREHSVRHGS
jgi:hypothetical protein